MAHASPRLGSESTPEPNFSLQLWNLRMHKKKVAHVALNPCCDWLLATASIDQTVKIWDLRQIKGKDSFLHSLPHRHPVNAGVTSQTPSFLWTLSFSPLAIRSMVCRTLSGSDSSFGSGVSMVVLFIVQIDLSYPYQEKNGTLESQDTRG